MLATRCAPHADDGDDGPLTAVDRPIAAAALAATLPCGPTRRRVPQLRPITLAWLASAFAHLGLLAGAWHGATAAPAHPPSPVTRSAWRTQAPITAYLELRAPVSAPGAAVIGRQMPTSTTPALTLGRAAARILSPDVAGPALPDPPAPPTPPDATAQEATAADEPVAAPWPARSGWGQASGWLAQGSIWHEGARQLALQGQARSAAAQHQATRLAAQSAHASYLLAWQQRVGTLALDGACEFTFASAELPESRCDWASDEALLISLAVELGPVPVEAN